MSNNFSPFSYNASGYQSVGPITAQLVASDPLADVAVFDVTSVGLVNISIKVAGAALNGLALWMRGDPLSDPIPLPLDKIKSYGRSDPGTDVAATPVGVTASLQIRTQGWYQLGVQAKSGGPAVLTITAGGTK